MNSDALGLLDLFPDAAFRHRMRFQPGSIRDFFGRTPGGEAILTERRRWLDQDLAAYADALPGGDAVIDEAWRMLCAEDVLDRNSSSPPGDARARAAAMGRRLEPDFMLLCPDDAGVFRLLAGCVCFPSSWGLAEKMGRPLEFIHGVVPDLNAQLGRSIHAFLSKLPPGEPSLRSNWGLSRSRELNQHPGRHLPRLDATVESNEIWLRVEHQLLVRLPQTRGILFGIRLAHHPFAVVQRDAELGRRLRQAIETMPDAMAEYKNIARCRARLLDLLVESSSRGDD